MKMIVLIALLFLGLCSAHIQHAGKFKPLLQSSPRVHTLPALDNKVLLANEDAKHGGYQFAQPVDFLLTSEESGFWSLLPNGARHWSITIRSEGALSLGVTFKGFKIPEGGELYVVGEKEVRGAFTAENNPVNENGYFVTFPLAGSSLTLEYFQPAHVKHTPSFNIIKVSHGYKPLAYGDSGTCNNNAVCDSSVTGGKWANEIRSVGMLLSGFGSRFCSGGLVNNALNDGRQLFLTAYHCSPDSSDLVLFNYQSATCTPNQDGPTSAQAGNLLTLALDSRSDFHILEIRDAIPASWNLYLSGVNGRNVAPTSLTGIHHPSGDIKKISYSNKAGVPTRWSALEPGLWHWEVPSWDDGTTEPGSSGSPLFDQNKYVIGQLHGGAASCRVIDYDSYGATWASWPLGLGKILDPQNSGVVAINGTNLA